MTIIIGEIFKASFMCLNAEPIPGEGRLQLPRATVQNDAPSLMSRAAAAAVT